MPLSFRQGPVRPFIAFRGYDDDAAGTMQLGLTTYGKNDNDEQTYQTTYLEWGGRSDHLVDAIDKAQGKQVAERLVSRASESERRYVGSDERNGITAASQKTVDVDAAEPAA